MHTRPILIAACHTISFDEHYYRPLALGLNSYSKRVVFLITIGFSTYTWPPSTQALRKRLNSSPPPTHTNSVSLCLCLCLRLCLSQAICRSRYNILIIIFRFPRIHVGCILFNVCRQQIPPLYMQWNSVMQFKEECYSVMWLYIFIALWWCCRYTWAYHKWIGCPQFHCEWLLSSNSSLPGLSVVGGVVSLLGLLDV